MGAGGPRGGRLTYVRERYNAVKHPTYRPEDLRAEFDRIERGIPHPSVFVDVRDFGLRGNGAHDDSAGVKNAWRQTVAAGGTLYFPTGTYNVEQDGIFSDVPTTTREGCRILGADQRRTTIKLITDGQERWFFNNAVHSSVLRSVSVEHIKLSTDDATLGNGWWVSSGATATPSPHYNHVAFESMAVCDRRSGTTNADDGVWNYCLWRGCTDKILWLENSESMSHTFVHPWVGGGNGLNNTARLVYVSSPGGGHVNVYSGFFAFNAEDAGEDRYIIEVVAGEGATAVGNQGVFNVHGLKVELRDANSKILYTPSRRDLVRAHWQGCNFTVNNDTSAEVISIAAGTVCVLRDCTLPPDRPSGPQTYRVGDDGSSSINNSLPASLLFEDCHFDGSSGSDLSANIVIEAQGFAKSRGFYVINGGISDGIRRAFDFDLGWEQAVRNRGGCMDVKVATIKALQESWPSQAGSSGRETVVLLPYGAYLKNIYVRKDTSVGGAVTYQLHVGNDDKTTTYGSSLTAAQAAVHEIDVRNVWAGPLTTTNTRKVRLWSTNDGADVNLPNIGAAVVVEYV